MDSAADLRPRVVALEHKLAALESWQRQKDVESARHDERWIAMEIRIDNRFSGLESSVRDIKTALSRINWMIIGGIVAGIVGFLIRGGFSP